MAAIDLTAKAFPLKTVFWGYHETGVATYHFLNHSEVFKTVAVVVPANRTHSSIDDLVEHAAANRIGVFRPKRLDDESFREKLRQLKPDMFMVDSFALLIPKPIIDLVYPLGFNLHPGRIPEYRGAHVMNWALINDEKTITLTMHLLTEKFDDGDIACEETVSITPFDTINDIDNKITSIVPNLLKKLENQIIKKKIMLRPPVGNNRYFSARKPEDGLLKKSYSAKQMYNLTRALTNPWPGAYSIQNEIRLVIWDALPVDLVVEAPPGVLIVKSRDVFLVSGDQKLLLLRKINDPGKKSFSPVAGKEIIIVLKQSGFDLRHYE